MLTTIIVDNAQVVIDADELTQYLRRLMTRGPVAYMPGTTNDDSYPAMAVRLDGKSTDDWQLVSCTISRHGTVDVVLGHPVYPDGPTQLVRASLYGPGSPELETEQLVGLCHADVDEIADCGDICQAWKVGVL